MDDGNDLETFDDKILAPKVFVLPLGGKRKLYMWELVSFFQILSSIR